MLKPNEIGKCPKCGATVGIEVNEHPVSDVACATCPRCGFVDEPINFESV